MQWNIRKIRTLCCAVKRGAVPFPRFYAAKANIRILRETTALS